MAWKYQLMGLTENIRRWTLEKVILENFKIIFEFFNGPLKF
jgi:hypothetical protein